MGVLGGKFCPAMGAFVEDPVRVRTVLRSGAVFDGAHSDMIADPPAQEVNVKKRRAGP